MSASNMCQSRMSEKEKKTTYTHPHTPDSAKNLAAEPLIANRLIHMKEKKTPLPKNAIPLSPKKKAPVRYRPCNIKQRENVIFFAKLSCLSLRGPNPNVVIDVASFCWLLADEPLLHQALGSGDNVCEGAVAHCHRGWPFEGHQERRID